MTLIQGIIYPLFFTNKLTKEVCKLECFLTVKGSGFSTILDIVFPDGNWLGFEKTYQYLQKCDYRVECIWMGEDHKMFKWAANNLNSLEYVIYPHLGGSNKYKRERVCNIITLAKLYPTHFQVITRNIDINEFVLSNISKEAIEL